MDISKALKGVGPLIKRNSSTILTGLGVAGSIGSAVLAAKATPRAIRKLDAAFLAKNNVELEGQLANLPVTPLTKREIIKTVWVDYVPAVGLEVVTIACIVGAQSINLRRQAVVISAFSASEAVLREYQERMAVEVPTKHRKVRDEMAAEVLAANPPGDREVVILNDKADQLFYEARTDRYFESTMNAVDKAVNDLNFRIHNQEYASVNDFYSLLGLKTVSEGDEFGWTPDQPLELDKSTHITDDGRAAVVIDYVRNPVTNYYKGFR